MQSATPQFQLIYQKHFRITLHAPIGGTKYTGCSQDAGPGEPTSSDL